MIVPNKAISYDESLMSKLPFILNLLNEPISPKLLYKKTNCQFEDISQYLLTLDTLFILGKIEFQNGELRRC